MSVVRVGEIAMPRTASIPLKGAREYMRAWNVWTDDQHTGAAEVVFAAGIPDYLTPYYTPTLSDNYALVVGKQSKQGSYRKHWVVEVKYSTDLTQLSRTDNPLDAPAEIGWSFASTTVVVEKDRNGNAIVNSAKQPINPPLTRERYALVLNYSANRPTYDPIQALDFMDTVNDSSFYGASAGQCRLTKWNAVRKVGNIDGTVDYYWVHDIEIHFLPNGWAEELQDRGPLELVSGKLKEPPAGETSGLVSAEPRLLDGNGRFLDPGETPVYLSFDVLRERNFALLGIV